MSPLTLSDGSFSSLLPHIHMLIWTAFNSQRDRLQISGVLCSLLSGSLHCDLQLSWFSWTLSSISSAQGVYLALPPFCFLASWPGSSLKSVSWENCRAPFVCLPIFLTVWGLVSWSPLFHVVCLFFIWLFQQEGTCSPCFPSWLETEITANF